MKRRSFAIILSSLVAAYAAVSFLAESTGCVDGTTPDCSGDSGCGPEIAPASDAAADASGADVAAPDGAVEGGVDAAAEGGVDGSVDAGRIPDAGNPKDARPG